MKDSTMKEATENKTGYSAEKKPEEEKPSENVNVVDEFGYDKSPVEKPEEEKPEEEKPEEEKPVEKPSTGYNEKPRGEEKPVEKPSEEEKTPEQLKEEFDSILGDLENVDKSRIVEFAIKNKMTKEQLQAYSELVKSDIAEAQKNVEEQRRQWYEELKNDPVFGKENFDKNVDRVEKLLDKHLPNTKKILTDRGGMMPPYIMRDLLGISKLLNPKTNFVNGEPSKIEEEPNDKDFLKELYK